ncbi:GNAT family N-acetyltransferase [Lentilactobacillus parafarraginis]|nr:GNAT family N-acetyltransferase [Lentilactobacillus parafarraginis]
MNERVGNLMIVTDRLAIRRLLPTDFQQYAELTAFPEVADGAGFNFISNPQMIKSALVRQLKNKGTYGVFEDQQLIGAVLLFERIGASGRPDPEDLEVSYFLRPDRWQMGYMTEALKTIVAGVKARHQVRSLYAEVLVTNARSVALLERLDFELVTKLRDPILGSDKLIYERKLRA